MIEAINAFLAELPDWSLVVLSTSLGWVIGSAIFYFWIELRGGF